MRQVIRRQHKALSTEDSYIQWLRCYVKALRQMPPGLSSEKKLETFLTDLARERDVSASTQNQAFNAILYFYREGLGQPLGNVKALRATRPVHERHAPTVGETQALLQTVRNQGGYPTNLIARMLYGCGLRVSEPLNLRIKDIDLERRRLCIRGAKGGNDRVVALPACLIPELTQQMQVVRAVWQRDKQDRTPVMLPHRLARKYPNTSSVGDGRGSSLPKTPAETREPGQSSATGCTRSTSSGLSSMHGASWASQYCHMSCVTHMQPIAWNEAQAPAPFSKPWGTSHWKPRWVTCTPRH